MVDTIDATFLDYIAQREPEQRSMLERMIVKANQESAQVNIINVRRCHDIGERYGMSVSLEPQEAGAVKSEAELTRLLARKRAEKSAHCAAVAISQKIAEYEANGYQVPYVFFPNDGNLCHYMRAIARALNHNHIGLRIAPYNMDDVGQLRRAVSRRAAFIGA